MKNKPKILVVDDQLVNVKLLEKRLSKAGLEVISAFNGEECIEKALAHNPEVILLDVVMPGMTGIETCKQLKAEIKTQDIPIIFITAQNSKEGKLEGLDAGGADYITKPIDLDETLARINTQLRIQENHRKNIELEKRLADMRQTAAIGHITEGIAHNLNNLLGVVTGYLDLLQRMPNDPKRVERSVDKISQAVQRMVRIIQQLTTIASKESNTITQHPLGLLIDSAVDRFLKEYKVNAKIEVIDEVGSIPIESNVESFEDIIGRLLMNAWESYPENTPDEARKIILELKPDPEARERYIHINVIDEGSGIDPEIEEHVFEPFVSSHSTVGRGLGLTVSRHVIRGMGGDLRLKPNKDKGTTATINYPL